MSGGPALAGWSLPGAPASSRRVNDSANSRRQDAGAPGRRTLDSGVVKLYCAGMAANATPAVHPGIQTDEQTGSSTELETGYIVICWNDPINLMDYVTHVFQVVFGWERKKAE